MGKEEFLNLGSTRAVCFTGPRASKMPCNGDSKSAEVITILQRLERAVLRAASEGKTVFINGCMAGIDVLAGETVLHLKRNRPGILCVTIAPFQAGFYQTSYWDQEWTIRAQSLYRQSDFSFALSPNYYKGVYLARNRFMVDHSSSVICYYAGTGGGTKFTLDYARKKGLAVINIAQKEPYMHMA